MAKAILTTITPVHVGSGETYNKDIDFAREKDEIGFFDLNKIVELIGQDQIGQLTSTIENNQSMLDFLRNGRKLTNPLNEFCLRTSKVSNISQGTTQLKEQYRTSLKGACIPGSSLKGSIKTAVWESMLTKSFLQDFRMDTLKRVRNFRGREKISWSDGQLDNRLFGVRQNEKSTRFLKVGDIHFNDMQTSIYESIILNQKFNKWEIKEGNRFLTECIPENQSAEFEIQINRDLLKMNLAKYADKFRNVNYLESIETLCKTVNSFTKIIIEWEIRTLEDAGFGRINEGQVLIDKYKDLLNILTGLDSKEFLIRIGGNSGWRFTTGGWIEKGDLNISDEDYGSICDTIQRKSYSGDVLMPKTRKTTADGVPFGFAKITINQ